MDAIISPQLSLIDLNDNDSKANSPQPTTTAKLIDISMGGVDALDNGQASDTISVGTLVNSLNSLNSELPSGQINQNASSASSSLTSASQQPNIVNSGISSTNYNTGASPKIRALTINQQSSKMHSAKKIPSISCTSNENCINNSVNTKIRWNPPMLLPLPVSFLRFTTCPINNVSNTINLPCDSIRGEYDLPDEQFAMMLQNEEFMNQLRWNQEFMSALDKEQCGGKTKSSEDDAAFKERLKNMGKMSRKKFLQMARVFTWQRNKKVTMAKQIDALPLKEEPSDDEDHHHQQQQQQHRAEQVQYVIQSDEQIASNNFEQDTQNQQQKFHFK